MLTIRHQRCRTCPDDPATMPRLTTAGDGLASTHVWRALRPCNDAATANADPLQRCHGSLVGKRYPAFSKACTSPFKGRSAHPATMVIVSRTQVTSKRGAILQQMLTCGDWDPYHCR